MELKPYQQQVINDLALFMNLVQEKKNIAVAFYDFWANHPRTPLQLFPDSPVEPYKNNIPRTPHVCMKVPTAGGKTFIAVNALKPIFDAQDFQRPKVVAWLVPSVTILDQTLKNFSNPDHPYRQKLDVLFNGRVAVYNKDRLLSASGFNPTSVREQLNIFVLSYDSFKSSNKEGRKSFQQNSSLAEFPKTYEYPGKLIPDVDETALIQVINQLNPVIVVDESHNAETELSVEMLRNMNPCFILDLTATPRKNSNIVSFVDSMLLKKENMVKLPVIVYNHHDSSDVISNALALRNNLEAIAIEEEKNGGSYIRPIILFQAQPKTSADSTTFVKIKQRLIECKIPAEHIVIKTADINELRKYDNVSEYPQGLMDKNCPVRFIITVNALKEGWDCPFAYILASIANRSSAVDVEQILGRVLRQPDVRQHSNNLLNMSYVFTASAQFIVTVENVVKALNKAGFSRRDFRAPVTDNTTDTKEKTQATELSFIPETQDTANDLELLIDIEKVQAATEISTTPILESIKKIAIETNNLYEQIIKDDEAENDTPVPEEIKNNMNSFKIKDVFKEDAEKISLPNFFIEVVKGDIFNTGSESTLLSHKLLLKEFKLPNQDINISFDSGTSELYQVDIRQSTVAETVPEYLKLENNMKDSFLKYISSLPEEAQITQLSGILFKELSKFDTIPDKDIKDYISRVISSLNVEQRSDLKSNPYRYADRIEKKIKALCTNFAEAQFSLMLDTDKILLKEYFHFSKKIHPSHSNSSIVKGLYESEDESNPFEKRIIIEVANLENIKFWHRNIERKGFYLNGFLNHYPDFIIVTKKGKIILLETKGDHLDGSDSKAKLRLGNLWARYAGDKYKYFMVFDNNPLPDALSLPLLIDRLKEM